MSRTLKHNIFVTEQIPQSGRGPLPDGSARMWSPITSTLITGHREAMLVDPPMTTQQATDVGDWIAASGQTLRQIYITHGHGDHWFGAIPLLQRFPGVTVHATEGTAALMAEQNDPQFRAEFWDRVFPRQLPAGDVEVSIVDHHGLEIDGFAVVPVEVGHTDTDATTMLHVPSSRLLVAGDVVYNDVHLYLTESGGIAGIDDWLAALDVAEALGPTVVIAGHKRPDAPDSPAQITATRNYLLDARRLIQSAGGAEDFYAAMMALHGGRINPGALWGGAITLLPQHTKES